MAFESEIGIMIMGMFFSYLIYRKNSLFGNLGFVGIGLSMMYWGTTASATVPHVPMAIGIIIVLGSIANTILDMT